MLTLIAPFVQSWNGQCVYEHTLATLRVGQNTWIELIPTLLRWRGYLCNDGYQHTRPQRIPTFPRELLLSIVSFLYFVQKLVLYRSNLSVDWGYQIDLAGHWIWISTSIAWRAACQSGAAPGSENWCVW